MDVCLEHRRQESPEHPHNREQVIKTAAQQAAVRDIYDAVPVALSLLDRNLRVVSLNRRMALLAGRPKEQLVGLDLAAISPALAGQVTPYLRRALAGESTNDVEVRAMSVLPELGERWFVASFVPLREGNSGVTGVLCAAVELTAFRRIEAALRESEDHYRHAVELGPNLAWTAEPDGRICDVSDLCVQATGVERDRLLGGGWLALVHPDDRQLVLQAWSDNVRTGKRHNIDFRFRHADGTYRWVHAHGTPRLDAQGSIMRWYGVLVDVHDRKQAETALKESERLAQERAALFQSVYAAAPVGLAFIDTGLCCRALNDRLAAMLGHTVETALGRMPHEFFRDRHAGEVSEQMLRKVIDSGVPVEDVEYEVAIGDPPVQRQFIAGFYPVFDAGRTLLGVSVAVTEVTDRKRSEAQIVHLAHHDPLTGLANRLLFRQRLTEALAGLGRRGKLAVHYLDLDQFKGVNDVYGHPMGDRLLIQSAERLRRCLRDGDIVARLGGDEFAVIQTGLRHRGNAAHLARRLNQAFAQPFRIGGETIVVGCSIGIALAPADGLGPDELAKRADTALYRAKADGRGTFRFFQRSMDEAAKLAQQLRTDMRLGIARGEFELHYQPLVGLRSEQATCFEALARWRHPVHGLLRPEVFIPIAEESGLIVPLGKFVLNTACQEAARWRAPVRVAVNLSVGQFRNAGIVRTVEAALRHSGLAPERLELEITESIFLDDTAANFAVLHALQALGVHVVLDDFGTGYSALAYLRRFPFAKLKIDRSFIQDLPEKSESNAIVRAIIALGRSLGVTVVAEGVEDARQLSMLREEGCDQVQGHLFSRPVPAGDVEAVLRRLHEVRELV